ncbi:hypothetical protein U879_11815 [Defluviimonas sp. 20V17]|uniref:Uncharacterized protein n=1 Tax=Allgaiera indica TaxID=765699 RepID=A0AAN4UMS5_9RHOB|nr:hypothetical protein [Allgaiera indica]KDB03498.1 hypothetical protein U879_11815 [Defluviimonas sp. 20V17]GHD98098.1 hypothetical protein GCM10008024_00250 [Allgaiera indica]SDW53963.1 hypothetical protein SAMN05444006_104192 [Allgaiera indica]
MTDPADAADFAAALDGALGAAQSLREEAETLSASIATAPPAKLRASSLAFEARAETTRSVFERLREVLRHANHHTLESAYQALVAAPGRQAEAAQMQELIREYKLARAIISRSERQIGDVLLEMKENRWAGANGPDDDDGPGLHAEA